MEKTLVIIRRKRQEQSPEKKQLNWEQARIAELQQRFGITNTETLAKALRYPERRIRELLKI